MKLKFKNQDFQTDAVNAVVDLFLGQEKTHSTFSVTNETQLTYMNDFGIGNALYIDEKTISDNDFVNITLHDYLKKTRFFGAPPIFTERSGVNIGGGPAA